MRARATWLVTIAAFCAVAAPAHAYVYWTDGDAGTIGRANLDGSGVDRDFITGAGSPRGIAVDEDHVYWADSAAGRIGRADLDGSDVDPDFITGASSPTGLAVDGSYVYWANRGSDTIGRASLDGSPVDQGFITGENDPLGLAVNDRGIYWSDAAGNVRRANVDGSGAATASSDGAALGLAVDGSRIIWASEQPAAAFVGDLSAGGAIVNLRTQSLAAPRSVALDAQRFYWATDRAIGRLNADGTGADAGFIAVADPEMLAVDAGQSGIASPSAPSLSFGIEAVGALGAGRTLTITNTGPGDLVFGVARVTGAHVEDFLLGPDTCSGARVAPGATCTVAVVFAPDAIGDREAALTLPSNDAASPLQIALRGTGEDPSPQGSDDFGDDPFGFDDEFEDDADSPPDKPRLITCRIVEVKAGDRTVERRRCRNRRLRGSPDFATVGAAHATLTRRGIVYATGTARRSRVVLDVHRRVRPGRYRLTLRQGNEVLRRVRIRIR